MSQTVRSLGAGLLFGAYLMLEGGHPVTYFQGVVQKSPLLAFTTALKTLAPEMARSAGLDMVQPIAWAAICIGVGLLVAGVVVPIVESLLFSVFSSIEKAFFGSSVRASSSGLARIASSPAAGHHFQ